MKRPTTSDGIQTVTKASLEASLAPAHGAQRVRAF